MTVTCTVCGEEVGRMGIGQHAGKHKREFEERFGRPPKGYDEVRENADELGHRGQETTLEEFIE